MDSGQAKRKSIEGGRRLRVQYAREDEVVDPQAQMRERGNTQAASSRDSSYVILIMSIQTLLTSKPFYQDLRIYGTNLSHLTHTKENQNLSLQEHIQKICTLFSLPQEKMTRYCLQVESNKQYLLPEYEGDSLQIKVYFRFIRVDQEARSDLSR